MWREKWIIVTWIQRAGLLPKCTSNKPIHLKSNEFLLWCPWGQYSSVLALEILQGKSNTVSFHRYDPFKWWNLKHHVMIYILCHKVSYKWQHSRAGSLPACFGTQKETYRVQLLIMFLICSILLIRELLLLNTGEKEGKSTRDNQHCPGDSSLPADFYILFVLTLEESEFLGTLH